MAGLLRWALEEAPENLENVEVEPDVPEDASTEVPVSSPEAAVSPTEIEQQRTKEDEAAQAAGGVDGGEGQDDNQDPPTDEQANQ